MTGSWLWQHIACERLASYPLAYVQCKGTRRSWRGYWRVASKEANNSSSRSYPTKLVEGGFSEVPGIKLSPGPRQGGGGEFEGRAPVLCARISYVEYRGPKGPAYIRNHSTRRKAGPRLRLLGRLDRGRAELLSDGVLGSSHAGRSKRRLEAVNHLYKA